MQVRPLLRALVVLLTCTFAVGLLEAAPSPSIPDVSAGQSESLKDDLFSGVYHSAGLAWLTVTNVGFVGARSIVDPIAPSLQYPGPDGPRHLWGGSLWVGGVVQDERRVTTGLYDMEFRQGRDDPTDTVYRRSGGCVGGSRYPGPRPDDDGDGLEDEDIPNGHDDDGDGLIDEDFAAFGAEYFVCTLSDTSSVTQVFFPDHRPLGIQVVQETFQFDDPENDDYIGMRFTVKNISENTINDVYLGYFADFDIAGLPEGSFESYDDRVASWLGYVQVPSGDWGKVELSYAWDSKPNAVSGYAGVTVLSQDIHASRFYAFNYGEEPSNDSERYEALSEQYLDNGPPSVSDFRSLVSVGPWDELQPGAEVVFDMALVCGATRGQLLGNAAYARIAYTGRTFDRDGDPETGVDGREFRVNWLREEDTLADVPSGVLVAGPRIDAFPNPFNPQLEISWKMPEAGFMTLKIFDGRGRLVRDLIGGDQPAGDGRVIWRGDNEAGRTMPSGVYVVSLTTAQGVANRNVSLVR